ncbi:MAG: SpoIIE family protein phosphatase [Solirubrobacteraceae bacterium MAG38_C4-C5]|nr:SpoIIE family protein phosphatase [Candidatus Siliceabacter maunaloa]
MASDVSQAIADPRRLNAVHASGLLDTRPEEPFDRLTRLAATVLDAPLAFATIVDDRRSYWKSAIGVTGDDAPCENPVEESFCQYVVGSNEALIVDDATTDARTRDNPSVHSMGVAAWAGFPLHGPDGEVLGSFCVVDTKRRTWSERDVETLRTLAASAAGEIALRAAVAQERDARGRADTLARTLQESLLPPELSLVPGLELAARFRPAGRGVELVGDFYDVFEDGRGQWHVLVGDVCGKGVEAAKLAALARYTVGATALGNAEPSAALRRLNEAVLRRHGVGGPFVTAVHGRLAPREGGVDVVVCAAGHPPPLVRRAGGTVERLEAPGTLIGVLEKLELHDVEARLGPGDALVLYTDGVTEARNGDGRLGEDGLATLMGDADGGSAEALAAAIDQGVAAGNATQRDDAATLVVRVPLR